jgi:anti-anti-sigma factor
MKFQGHPDVTIDMVSVEYMSSSHLGVIAGASSDAHRAGGSIKIIAKGTILDLIKSTGIDQIVTLEEA